MTIRLKPAFLEPWAKGYDATALEFIDAVRPIIDGTNAENSNIAADRFLTEPGKAAKVRPVLEATAAKIMKARDSRLDARRPDIDAASAAIDKASGAMVPIDPSQAQRQQARHAEIRTNVRELGLDDLGFRAFYNVADDEVAFAIESAPMMFRKTEDGIEVLPRISAERIAARRRSRALVVDPDAVARLDTLREEERTILHLASVALGELESAIASLPNTEE